jgi:hypothetical protein
MWSEASIPNHHVPPICCKHAASAHPSSDTTGSYSRAFATSSPSSTSSLSSQTLHSPPADRPSPARAALHVTMAPKRSFTSLSFISLALSLGCAVAVPAPITEPASDSTTAGLDKRQSITALSAAQISSFKPFTFFASAAYCQPSTTLTWTCGGMWLLE